MAGGLILNGSWISGGGSPEAFQVWSRQIEDEDGWISWYSADARVAVRWDGAYDAQVLCEANQRG
jgi:hypothetical protein